MLALISGCFAALFSNGVAWFVALKIFIGALIMVVLPIVLNNFFASILTGFTTLVNESSSTLDPVIVSLTGVTGYIADQLELPAAFAVIFSAFATKMALRMIPFLRL
jgi:hypothetical protein